MRKINTRYSPIVRRKRGIRPGWIVVAGALAGAVAVGWFLFGRKKNPETPQAAVLPFSTAIVPVHHYAPSQSNVALTGGYFSR